MRYALAIVALIFVVGCEGGGGKVEPKPWPSNSPRSVAPGSTPGSEFMPPDAKEEAAALPKCAEIWVAGKTLAQDYEGCQTDRGGLDRGASYACTDGGGELIGYNDQFFARRGGVIRAYGEDEAAFSHELFEVCKPN